jgi:hypothetical protein
MNYLAIIALSLGLLAMLITVQYVQSYKDLTKELNKVVSGSQQPASPLLSTVTRMKDKLDYTDQELSTKINKKEDKLMAILKEPFAILTNQEENKSPYQTAYLSAQQRQIDDHTNPLIRSIEIEPVMKMRKYEDDEQMAKWSIERPTPAPLPSVPYMATK